MFVQLGKRQDASDVVDLLLECHERIRRFLTMARTLATAQASEAEEIRLAASQIRRYFAEALPLHVADEQEEILPRLASTAPAVDRALTAMTDEHAAHEALVAELIATCDDIARDPRQLPAQAQRLATVARELTAELDHHLEQEERLIFPAVRELPRVERDAILAAMRHRRDRVLS